MEIPFRPNLHANSAKSMSKKGKRKQLTALSLVALYGARKAPKTHQS